MGKAKYIIYFSKEDRNLLENIVKTEPEKTALRARILLCSDFNSPEYAPAPKLAERLGTSHTTVQIVRKEYSELGLMGCIYPKGTLSYNNRALLTDEKRALILEMIKEKPPYGQKRWTINVIRDELVKRGIFDRVSYNVIQKFIKTEEIDLNPNKI